MPGNLLHQQHQALNHCSLAFAFSFDPAYANLRWNLEVTVSLASLCCFHTVVIYRSTLPAAQSLAGTVLNAARSTGNLKVTFERQRRVQQRGVASNVTLCCGSEGQHRGITVYRSGSSYTGSTGRRHLWCADFQSPKMEHTLFLPHLTKLQASEPGNMESSADGTGEVGVAVAAHSQSRASAALSASVRKAAASCSVAYVAREQK